MNQNIMLEQWRKERDAAVATLDIKEFKKFYLKWKKKGMYNLPLPSDKVLEMVVKKMAMEISTMPPEVKQRATEWFLNRKYGFRFNFVEVEE